MKKLKMDKSERDTIKSIEQGEWQPAKNREALMLSLKKAAVKTSLKDYRMNIRVSSRDVEALKSKALEEGIPYQTLVSSILHKYVAGKFIEQV